MADPPINLRRWKKRRARQDARAEADANAARHGRPGQEKAQTKAERDRARRDLDGQRLDDDGA